MEFNKEGNILVAKLDHGTDLFETLLGIMEKIEETSGVVISGIGMIENFKLGYYNSNTGQYDWKEYQEPMELLSLKGSITEEGSIHIHAQVADEDHKSHGGHLDNGNIYNVGELTMLVFKDMKLKRKRDEDRQMDLLSVE
ncbi:MAG: PPC domain-containing DNA-binding protein [Thermoplasmatota archaeon]